MGPRGVARRAFVRSEARVCAGSGLPPPGVGALWIRPGLDLTPQVVGGGQEGGLRSGTENLAGAVGLGVAAEFAFREGPAEATRVQALPWKCDCQSDGGSDPSGPVPSRKT